MADENLYSLLIRVEGGDVAAAEIIKSKYALKAVGAESDALQGKFQEGFQHLALKGFIADAARSVGLGMELRPILSMLNVGITELGESLGIASGGMTLMLTGLAAVAALAVVVHNHFAKHVEDLAAVLKGYQDDAKAIDDYVAAGGRLSTTLATLRKDLESNSQATLQSIMAKNQATLADDQQALRMAQNTLEFTKRHAAQEDLTGLIKVQQKAIEDHQKAVDKDNALLEANAHGFATVAEYAKGGTEAIAKNSEELDKNIKKLDQASQARTKSAEKENADIEKLIAAQGKYEETGQSLAKITEQLNDTAAEATRNSYEKRNAAADKFYDDETRRILKLYQEGAANAANDPKKLAELQKQADDALTAADNAKAAKMRENYSIVAQEGVKAAQLIQSSFNSTFAAMVTGQTRTHQQMVAAQKQLEAQLAASFLKAAEDYVVAEAKKAFFDDAREVKRKAAAMAAVTTTGSQQVATDALTISLQAAADAAIALAIALAAVA